MSHPERLLSLREANQAFSRVVREVEAGAAYTITRNGKPVARLVPVEAPKRVLRPEQQAAWERTEVRMEKGWDLGGWPGREVLYER
jgi:prevent-host-death family protein